MVGAGFRSLILFEKGKSDIVAISVFQTFGLIQYLYYFLLIMWLCKYFCFLYHRYIYSFGVDAKYRRLGIGKFMIKCTFENMIDMHCMEASLNVNTNNVAAIKLYQSNGFVIDYDEIDALKGFYGYDDPMGPDAFYMIKVLPTRKPYTGSDSGDRKIWRKFSNKQWNLVQRVNGLIIGIDEATSAISK